MKYDNSTIVSIEFMAKMVSTKINRNDFIGGRVAKYRLGILDLLEGPVRVKTRRLRRRSLFNAYN